jgi:hypothetical protein
MPRAVVSFSYLVDGQDYECGPLLTQTFPAAITMRLSRSWLTSSNSSELGDGSWRNKLNPFSRSKSKSIKCKSNEEALHDLAVSPPVLPAIPQCRALSEGVESITTSQPSRTVSRPPSSLGSSSFFSSETEMMSPVSPLSSSSKSVAFSFAGCDPLPDGSERPESRLNGRTDLRSNDEADVLVLTLTVGSCSCC